MKKIVAESGMFKIKCDAYSHKIIISRKNKCHTCSSISCNVQLRKKQIHTMLCGKICFFWGNLVKWNSFPFGNLRKNCWQTCLVNIRTPHWGHGKIHLFLLGGFLNNFLGVIGFFSGECFLGRQSAEATWRDV